MNVFIILKCGFKDSFDFISQVSNINGIKNVTVFRDDNSLQNDKVDYVVPSFRIFSALKNLFRLFQIILRRRLKPSIIIGIYEIPHGLIAVLAGKILKVPSAVSIIGNPAYQKLRKGLRMKLTMWILNKASFVTVTGNNSKKFLVEKGIPKDKVFVLPNTIDFSNFRLLPEINKKYDLISLGRISEEKHVEIIIDIAQMLKEKKNDLKVAIAGKGPKLNEVVDKVKALQLENNIEILGFIPDEQLESFFNSGRVFVLSSETEGFPRTIVQAAACGVPVVSSKVGDIEDIIEDNFNGFLVSSYKNIEEFVEKILKLYNDEDLYNKFSSSLLMKVHQHFSPSCATVVWQQILSKLKK